jgi:hypothetical protein
MPQIFFVGVTFSSFQVSIPEHMILCIVCEHDYNNFKQCVCSFMWALRI